MLPPDFSSRLLRLVATVSVLTALAACGGGGEGSTGGGTDASVPSTGLPQTYTTTGKAATGAVFVHLFEWKWSDIARECENFLGPKGFAAVQVSPPNEHAVIAGTSSGAAYPWWQRYQPVSYGLTKSRSGTLAEFQDMVSRCKTAGVEIYVDAVINHMAAGAGVGSNGTSFTSRNFAPLYSAGDFHVPICSVTNYNDASNVQNCDLVGLPDLNTGADTVRQKIADHMAGLVINYGVAGLRIDAAKHISPIDLDAIVTRTNNAAVAAGKPRPYYFLEVINNAGEAVKASDYYGVGFASGGGSDITEFQYGDRISDAFLNRNSQNLGTLLASTSGTLPSGLIPTDKSVVFSNNHDNQRASNIYYADGAAHDLAYVYMLAQPYGYPSVMSSYTFDRATPQGRDTGPPSDTNGNTNDIYDAGGAPAGCSPGPWVCEHRRPEVAAMLGFRKAVRSATNVTNAQTISANAIAFGRGDRGFVIINRETTPVSGTFATGMAAGNYCDVINGNFSAPSSCSRQIVVDAASRITVTVPALSAIALHADAKLP